MKVTMHKGRAGKNGVFLAGHNDRTKTENADHIDREKSVENVNKIYDFEQQKMIDKPDDLTLENYEKNVYRDLYSDGVEAQNERNEKAGHPERNKSIDDLYNSKKTCIESEILQVGDKDESADPERFKEAVEKYVNEYNEKYKNSKIIDYSVHVDEATPHAHLRTVYFAESKGNTVPTQTKALEQMGIELPDPEKKESKFNCRKQTFTAENREDWLKICKEIFPDLNIEDPPLEPTRRKHMEKNEYIIYKQSEEINELKQKLAENEKQVFAKAIESKELDDKIELQNIDYDYARKRTYQAVEQAKLKEQKLSKLAEEEKKAQLDVMKLEIEKQKTLAQKFIEIINEMLRLIKNASEKSRKELFAKEPNLYNELKSQKESLQSLIDRDVISDRGDLLDHIDNIYDEYKKMIEEGDHIIKAAEFKLKEIEAKGSAYSNFAEKQRREIERLKNLQKSVQNPENLKRVEESIKNITDKVVGHKFIRNTPELEADYKNLLKYAKYGVNHDNVVKERDKANQNTKKAIKERDQAIKERDYARVDLQSANKIKDSYYNDTLSLKKELNALKIAKGIKKVIDKTQDDDERTR